MVVRVSGLANTEALACRHSPRFFPSFCSASVALLVPVSPSQEGSWQPTFTQHPKATNKQTLPLKKKKISLIWPCHILVVGTQDLNRLWLWVHFLTRFNPGPLPWECGVLCHWTTRVPKPYLFQSLFDMEEVFLGARDYPLYHISLAWFSDSQKAAPWELFEKCCFSAHTGPAESEIWGWGRLSCSSLRTTDLNQPTSQGGWNDRVWFQTFHGPFL